VAGAGECGVLGSVGICRPVVGCPAFSVCSRDELEVTQKQDARPTGLSPIVSERETRTKRTVPYRIVTQRTGPDRRALCSSASLLAKCRPSFSLLQILEPSTMRVYRLEREDRRPSIKTVLSLPPCSPHWHVAAPSLFRCGCASSDTDPPVVLKPRQCGRMLSAEETANKATSSRHIAIQRKGVQ